ncbi:class I SAM-dependent methyltransferase [Fodinibius saliphilus]|uniref:class I SAM-dependent methyltransferase n=1 Tax=Fodinibius saliphilus TaxID=1920650 RepID=UPI001108B115|nr:class I SAM-dependent methyltransferase [Fodinibius saliphilus]
MKNYFQSYKAHSSCLPSFSLLFIALFLIPAHSLTAQNLDVPYVATPQKVVSRMLEIADLQPSDYVIDLGSGDGRIVITAALHGASGHGVELDPKRIKEAREKAYQKGVDKQVMFVEADIFETDFSNASIITMYLLPSINKKLRPELLQTLEPGTKIVSHSFDMGKWEPDKQDAFKVKGSTHTHNIFYWVIPANVEGSWQWSNGTRTFSMDITQNFQKIEVNLTDNQGATYSIKSAYLKGRRITIKASNGAQSLVCSGRIGNNQIDGIMQIHADKKAEINNWNPIKN